MVNRELLEGRARRAYELARVRVAARAAWLLGPLAAACALVTGAGDECACLGALLLVAAVVLRWRSRQGAEGVAIGLFAGAIPLVAALVVARVAPECVGAPVLSPCAGLCFAASLPAGMWLGLRAARGRLDVVGRVAAVGVASILVPYPHAVDDHQTANARFLADRGAAWLLPHAQADSAGLCAALRGLSREQLLAMALKAREAARPDATREVADICESVASTGRNAS
jgi:hypothetical protein